MFDDLQQRLSSAFKCFDGEKGDATFCGILLPRRESFASLHILTRRASEGSEALPSLARRVRMSFFGARIIQHVAVEEPCTWQTA